MIMFLLRAPQTKNIFNKYLNTFTIYTEDMKINLT